MPSKIGSAIILGLALGAAYMLLGIKVDTRHDRLLDSTSRAAQDYQRFLETFGSDEFVIVALSGKPLFDEDSLDAMVDGLDRIEAVAHVKQVSGLPAVFRDRYGSEDPEALEEEMTNTPFYDGLFISEDRQHAGLLIETEVLDAPQDRVELTAGLREAVQPLKDFGFRVDLVGTPIFNVVINEYSRRDTLIMFPLAAVFSLAMLIYLLRSVKAVIIVLICGALSLLLTMGSIGAAGLPLNVVTTSIPLVLWVLSIVNGIHVLSRYQAQLFALGDVDEALKLSLSEVRWPCTLAAITTALGYLSNMVSSIAPIREYSFFMALGMMLSLGVNLILAPTMITWLRPHAPRGAISGESRPFHLLAEWVARHRYGMIAAWIIVYAICIYGTTLVESDPDSLSFLPEDSELVQSYNYIMDNLTGTRSIELVIDTPGGWTNPEYWPALQAVADGLGANPNIARVVSPLDFLKKANQWDHDLTVQWYTLPETREQAEHLLELAQEEGDSGLERFVTAGGEQIRMSALETTTRSSELRDIVDAAESELAALPGPMCGLVTGMSMRLENMQHQMMNTQIASYAIAFVLIFGCIWIGMRSVGATVLAVPPNVIPAFGILAIMGFLDISLNAATVMVSSISLGIAVDDSLHNVAHYTRLRHKGHSAYDSVIETMGAIGPEITTATATACIGFFTLAFSAFAPISQLGMLSGAAMLIALLADVLLVPAMILVWPRAAETTTD
ncbi:MAG: MMPL family transporter [Candidatus Hydrogenedentota bacterium]